MTTGSRAKPTSTGAKGAPAGPTESDATAPTKRKRKSLLGDDGRPFPVKFNQAQLDAIAEAARRDMRSSASDWIRVTVLKALREMGLWDVTKQPGPDGPPEPRT